MRQLQRLETLIHEIRGQRVILDTDLARIYGVETRALNQAIRRNPKRFPSDFVFHLTKDDVEALRSRSQSVTLKRGQNIKYLPLAFTEHGAIMAANVLNSDRAVEMSVFVVRAFVKLRDTLASHKELGAKIDELDRRVGSHDKAIASIIAAIRQLTAQKPPAIGFRVKRNDERDKKRSPHARKK